MSDVVAVSEHQFEVEVLQSAEPVVVDFYAPWCGPCKMIAPVLEKLAGEFAGRVKFAKVNVDEAPGLAGHFNITGVPTLILVRDGQLVDQVVGMVPPARLRTWIEGQMPAGAASKERQL